MKVLRAGRGQSESMKNNPEYATREEVEHALARLTDHDYIKLMMIAQIFCKRYRFSMSEMEPKELLSQAVLKTLQNEDGKRWVKSLSLIKHLDRAMENISGHFVKTRVDRRSKVIPFPNELGSHTGDQHQATSPSPQDLLIERERIEELMKSVFVNDDRAARVFQMRVESYGPAEIQFKLGLSDSEYETINRRILRRISGYTNT
jgi:hypothetical protein